MSHVDLINRDESHECKHSNPPLLPHNLGSFLGGSKETELYREAPGVGLIVHGCLCGRDFLGISQ